MSWNYFGQPEQNPVDWVRFKIGDTDALDPQLQDEEVNAMLFDNPNRYKAAAECCDAIAAKYARQVTKSIGRGFSVGFETRMGHYTTLAKRLRMQGASRSAVPYAGGISQNQKDTYRDDTDIVPPYFSRDDGPFADTNGIGMVTLTDADDEP